MSDNSTAIIIIKVCELIVLLSESIICGLLPIYWYSYYLLFHIFLRKKFKNNFKAMGVANAFSGGIFFAVCMIHILPDVRTY